MSIVVGDHSDMTIPLANKTLRIFTGLLNFPPGGLNRSNLAGVRVVIPNSVDFISTPPGLSAQVSGALSSIFAGGGVVAVDRIAVDRDPAGLALLVWVVAKDDATVYAVSYHVHAYR